MLRRLHNLVIAFAWLFVIASLIPLVVLLIAVQGWVGSGEATVFQTTTNGKTFTAWGLQYQGLIGSLLIWAQLLGVSAALWLSTKPQLAVRRTAVAAILAWTLLLLGNAWWLRTVANWDMLPGAAVCVTIGFACALYYAAWQWRASPRQPIEINVAARKNHTNLASAAC